MSDFIYIYYIFTLVHFYITLTKLSYTVKPYLYYNSIYDKIYDTFNL